MVLTTKSTKLTGFYLVRNIRVSKSEIVTRQIVCWSHDRQTIYDHRARLKDATNQPSSAWYSVEEC